MMNLNCSHKTCIQCSTRWFIQHNTCPICRQHTDLFNKETRSDDDAYLLFDLSVFIFDVYKNVYENNIPLYVYTQYIEHYFLDKKLVVLKHKH